MKLLILFAFIIASESDPSFAQPSVQWRFNTKDASFGQSAAGDIDGDGKLEVVFGCYRNDSMIYALNAENGSLLWKFNAAGAGEGCNDVAPLIYDVDGDNSLDVVVPSSCNPKTFCFNGKTGAVKWVCNTRGSDSPPVIADIDGDGKPEILHGEFGGYVLCINAEDGSKAWELAVDTASWIQTAPTLVDANGDGQLDFIVGTWNNRNKADNKVYAFDGRTRVKLWSYPIRDFMYHGSAVGDLDGDGKPELLIGAYNDTLYCINAENGTTAWKYKASGYVGCPAIIADLDDDGKCDVLLTPGSDVVALNANGSLKWKVTLPGYQQSFRGAAVADVNNDRYPDAVFATSHGRLMALSGLNGAQIFDISLRKDYGDSLFSLDHAPIIADFNKDGKLDAFVAGGYATYPDFFRNFGRAYMVTLGKGNGPDWLMFQNDPARRSNVCGRQQTGIAGGALLSPGAFEVFPVPAAGTVHFRFTLAEPANVRVRIYNSSGRQVAILDEETLAAGIGTIAWTPSSHLPAGVYLAAASTGASLATQRFVLAR